MRFHSFMEALAYYGDRYPQNNAFLYYDEGIKTVTYKDFKELVIKRSEELKKLNKSCLGVLSDGSFTCVLEIFAAIHEGMQVVMLDENLDEEILKGLIRYTDVDLLWGDEELLEELNPYLTGGVKDGKGKILFFTSGTTERSKAVVLSEESLMASAYNGGNKLPLERDDILLNMLPMGHVFGFVCGLLWGLSCGCSVALGRGSRHYHEDCLLFKPTALSAVPLLWGFLVKHKALNPELKTVLIGAGDCPDLLLKAGEALGIRMCFGYGLTETSSGVAISTDGNYRAMEVCIDDEIIIAEDGEILIKAPTCMMEGYYKMPEATEKVLSDGVLYTGDLGYLDGEGRLHITGRKKEMLVLSDGTKVFLPEYERECAQALGNNDLCICMKDDILTLIIVSEENIKPEDVLKDLKKINDLRPRSQKIQRVEIRNTPLPRTASGKIKRWEI